MGVERWMLITDQCRMEMGRRFQAIACLAGLTQNQPLYNVWSALVFSCFLTISAALPVATG